MENIKNTQYYLQLTNQYLSKSKQVLILNVHIHYELPTNVHISNANFKQHLYIFYLPIYIFPIQNQVYMKQPRTPKPRPLKFFDPTKICYIFQKKKNKQTNKQKNNRLSPFKKTVAKKT